LMLLFCQIPAAGFDLTRLSDYGVLGLVLAAVMYSLNNVANALKAALEKRATDARDDLASERVARQAFEVRMTSIQESLIKAVGELSDKVGMKMESINQLTMTIRELFELVHEVKKDTRQVAERVKP
jgi:hypothetical protein